MMERDFSRLADQHFDLLVIGGGVYGAWTAFDAALRGLTVALLERGDWACGTSSASSKLVHGGLRYLEQLDLGLVKKTLGERRLLMELGPHRVWPLRFGIPLYADRGLGAFKIKAGLTLYDVLAGTLCTSRGHHRIDRSAFAKQFPALNPEILRGGFTYLDAQTDDARFVLELVAGAIDCGAVCLNHCRVIDYTTVGGRVSGIEAEDGVDGTRGHARADCIVNAAGAWMSDFKPSPRCRLSKGVHLVMPKLPGDQALLLTARSDGRVFFILPWYGRTLLGTTDTDYRGVPDLAKVEAEDIDYLLTEANRVLAAGWGEADVVGRFAGLRVLRWERETSPSDVSREWQYKSLQNGIIYSVGGKLTSARADSARLVDAACRRIGRSARCKTADRRFPWCPEGGYDAWQDNMISRCGQLGIDPESARWLLKRQGKRAEKILAMVNEDPSLSQRIDPNVPVIHADLRFCAASEMVVHLDDLLRRRLPLLILSPLSEMQLSAIGQEVGRMLGWSEKRLGEELDRCREAWAI